MQVNLQVLASKLVDTIVDTHINPIPYDPKKRKPPYPQMFEHLMQLLLIALTRLPTAAERHLPKYAVAKAMLTEPKYASEAFPTGTTKRTIERLDAAVEVSLLATMGGWWSSNRTSSVGFSMSIAAHSSARRLPVPANHDGWVPSLFLVRTPVPIS